MYAHVCTCVHIMQSQHETEKQRLQNRMHLEHRQHKMREEVLEKKLMETKRLLAKAERSLEKFRAESPDWKEPDHLDLNRADSRAFQQAFDHVDRKLDIKLQLKHDPTGALTTFWSEQRRRLHVNKRAKWNPQVHVRNIYVIILTIIILTLIYMYC